MVQNYISTVSHLECTSRGGNSTGRVRRLGVSLDCKALWVEDEMERSLSALLQSIYQELVNGRMLL